MWFFHTDSERHMTAFVGYDNKLYLGKSENYLFSDNGFAYYDNSDKSLTYITDNLTLYPFLYGSGRVCSQQEMLDNGSFTKEIDAEFDRLQKGVLSQFEQILELKFADIILKRQKSRQSKTTTKLTALSIMSRRSYESQNRPYSETKQKGKRPYKTAVL